MAGLLTSHHGKKSICDKCRVTIDPRDPSVKRLSHSNFVCPDCLARDIRSVASQHASPKAAIAVRSSVDFKISDAHIEGWDGPALTVESSRDSEVTDLLSKNPTNRNTAAVQMDIDGRAELHRNTSIGHKMGFEISADEIDATDNIAKSEPETDE